MGLTVESCDPGEEVGSGIAVAPGIALTSAHVVAGARGIIVTQQGRESEGTIVAFDPEMDLAYVAFDAPGVDPPEVASDHVERDTAATAYVVRSGEVVALPVRIRRRVNIRTEDIYIQGETLRPGFELDADVESGDSGGAVMVAGKVVGVIWARSNRFEDRAYAIDAVRAADLIDEQRRTGRIAPDIDVTRCH